MRYVGVQIVEIADAAFKAQDPLQRHLNFDAPVNLLVQQSNGLWYEHASHVSSTTTWAQLDIQRHYERRGAKVLARLDDTYEWLGVLLSTEVYELYPPGPQPESAAAEAP